MMSRPITLPAGVFWALAVMATVAIAQVSDYELTENFKQSYRKLEQAMASAVDSAGLDIVAGQVQDLKTRYMPHQKLLDEALYPQTFVSVFEAIDSILASRRRESVEREKRIAREQSLAGELEKKTRENEKLQAELDQMTQNAARLSREGEALRSQVDSLKAELSAGREAIAYLKAESKTDKESIDRISQLVEALNTRLAARDRLVAELKGNLKDRDAVVAEMGKKLLERFGKPQVNTSDIQTLTLGVDDSDYFGTVLETIEENIRFVESTFLTPGDLEFTRAEQLEFLDMWKTVGPRLSAAYPSDGATAGSLAQIESAMNRWKSAIDDAAWKNLNTVFVEHDFALGPFSNGKEFRDRLISFIYEEKKTHGRDNFERFNHTVWGAEVKPLWIPYLQSKAALDDSQLADVEGVLADWGKRSYALYWLFGLAALLAISVAILVVKRR